MKNLIYPNVKLGKNVDIQPPCIIGKPPRGKKEGELLLEIGDNCVIRPFTTIYAGTIIGKNFQCGQCVSIREENIIGDNSSIGTNCCIEYGNEIGNNVRIHSMCFLERVIIEDNVFVAPNVVFTDDPHPACPEYDKCTQKTLVKRLAKIGANSIILPGIVIGENALIGAGSIVSKNVEKEMLVMGVPAKPVKNIFEIKCFAGIFENAFSRQPYAEEKRLKVKQ